VIRDTKSILLTILGSAIGKTITPIAIDYTITTLGTSWVIYASVCTAVVMVSMYIIMHLYILRRETVSARPRLAPVAGRPFNTYQRAQSLLYDTKKVGGYGHINKSKPNTAHNAKSFRPGL
jgi:hypothetical protein